MFKSLITIGVTSALKAEPTEHPNIVKAKNRDQMGTNPFEDLPENVNMITYSEGGGFTTKLTERKRDYIPSDDKRRGWKTQGQKTWKQSIREMAKSFMPRGATADVSVDFTNWSNVYYTSPLYLGS